MIPRRRVVKTYYWACTNREHRHRHEHIARRCIAKAEQRRPKVARWTFARYVEAQQLREAGKTLNDLGQHFDVTRERIRQVLKHWEWWLRQMERDHPRRTPDKRWGHYYNPNPDGSETLYLIRPDASGLRFAAHFKQLPPVPHIPRGIIAEKWCELRAKSRAFRYKQVRQER